MKVYKQITDIFVKIVSAALMVLVAGIVGIMLYELCLRNFFNKSFRSSTELCGFLFMWMAFLGVVVLYDKDRLITLDMLYVRANPKVQTTFWFINKLFSLGLGIIMIVAYKGMYQLLLHHAVSVQSLAFPAHGHRGRIHCRKDRLPGP